MIRVAAVFRDGVATTSTPPDPIESASTSRDLRSALAQVRDVPAPGTTDFTWLSVVDPTPAEMSDVTAVFDLDPLLVADSMSLKQRPKVEVEDSRVFVLLKALEWIDETSDVVTTQVSVFVGAHYAITVRHGGVGEPEGVLQRLKDLPEVARCGSLSLLWSVLDHVVDGYLDVGDAVQEDIEEIEQQVFSPRPADAATRIYRLNRENIEMRRAVRPLVNTAQRLVREDSPRIPPALKPYMRDLADHILRASDMVDGFDSTLMTMLMASTARQDLMQNNDMRKISAWAAIIAVPTAIAGIYGMNFEDMPELHWALGYPAVLLFMGVVCLVLYRGFKKSGWL